MSIKLQDRFRGLTVGVLAGDALGAPYETWKAADAVADLLKRGGLTGFDYPNPWYGKTESVKTFPMGRPTDDSDHTAALAQSLLACNGLNEEDLYRRLRHIVVDGVSPLWEGKALGAGRTTREILKPETYEESRLLPKDRVIPSNGSLMRSSPMALYFVATRPSRGILPEMVMSMSEVTHLHPLAGQCCVVYVSILCNLLFGWSPKDAIERARYLDIPWDDELVEIIDNPLAMPRDPEVWPGRGAAVLTLHVALWALLTTTNFREGITKAVSVGGDTDTYAAVAGALLGAYYGEQGIPHEWRDILIGRKVMEHLADEFSVLANECA